RSLPRWTDEQRATSRSSWCTTKSSQKTRHRRRLSAQPREAETRSREISDRRRRSGASWDSFGVFCSERSNKNWRRGVVDYSFHVAGTII
ncbi:unnamed protein product, partial [Ectocarpus sp. 12 AP-2014]